MLVGKYEHLHQTLDFTIVSCADPGIFASGKGGGGGGGGGSGSTDRKNNTLR